MHNGLGTPRRGHTLVEAGGTTAPHEEALASIKGQPTLGTAVADAPMHQPPAPMQYQGAAHHGVPLSAAPHASSHSRPFPGGGIWPGFVHPAAMKHMGMMPHAQAAMLPRMAMPAPGAACGIWDMCMGHTPPAVAAAGAGAMGVNGLKRINGLMWQHDDGRLDDRKRKCMALVREQSGQALQEDVFWRENFQNRDRYMQMMKKMDEDAVRANTLVAEHTLEYLVKKGVLSLCRFRHLSELARFLLSMQAQGIVSLSKEDSGENCILGWRQLEILDEDKLEIFNGEWKRLSPSTANQGSKFYTYMNMMGVSPRGGHSSAIREVTDTVTDMVTGTSEPAMSCPCLLSRLQMSMMGVCFVFWWA
jgi:hypothetical protein